MNPPVKQHSLLAAVAVVSLAIYVLACSSFSPDDSKVLFPAVDPKSGDLGVAVYDRKGGGTEQVFVVSQVEKGISRSSKPVLIRPQWMPDGKSMLVMWPDSVKGEALNIALVPYGRRGPTRMYTCDGLKDAAALLMSPMPVADRKSVV